MGKESYDIRLKRINDALALKEPDRVPCAPHYMAFPFLWAGYTITEVNYDVQKAKDALRRYFLHFEPDMAYGYVPTFAGQMPLLEKLGAKWTHWPGSNGSSIPHEAISQYIEIDSMKDDDYPLLLQDMSGMTLNRYLPRAFKVFKPFKHLNLTSLLGYFTLPGIMQFADPEILEAVETLHEVAIDLISYYAEAAEFDKEIEEMGFVQQVAGYTYAPFELLIDSLRGTLDTRDDLINRPQEVAQAIERLFPEALYGAIAQAKNSNGRMVYVPLRKSMESILHDEHCKTMYWDSLLKLINGLVDSGLTPWIYSEGPYDSRIECLMDVPPGTCWIHFQEADMARVKRLLGQVACLSGGMNTHSLLFGTAEQVIDEVKKNMEILAPGGGYIFDLGETMEQCKPENVEVMFETVKMHGTY